MLLRTVPRLADGVQYGVGSRREANYMLLHVSTELSVCTALAGWCPAQRTRNRRLIDAGTLAKHLLTDPLAVEVLDDRVPKFHPLNA